MHRERVNGTGLNMCKVKPLKMTLTFWRAMSIARH